jgi:hypothetical protein
MQEWSEALNIISDVESDASPEPLHPKHEEINIHADPSDFDDDQLERLEELGVYAASEEAQFPHFYVFC